MVRPLVVRLDRSGGLSTIVQEARCLEAVAGRLPVPAVVASGDDPSVLGAPFVILERLGGETIPRKLLRDERYATARGRLVAQAVDALAAIHATGPEAVPGLDASDPLETWAGVLHTLDEPHPALELGLRWLVDHRPPPSGHTLVHGDFRLGNLLVDEEGLTGVLDWELAHVGDPAEDLGWMCVRAWRFSSPLPALGLAGYEELLSAYEAASGRRVDRTALDWWEAFGTWRWGVMCVLMASHARAMGRLSVELAAIGRRACENESDLLACLARSGLGLPIPSAPAEAGQPGGRTLHDRPSAAELVGAVRRFLDEEVRPATAGSTAFHARVAVNVLATVERELASGAGTDERWRELLARAGCASDEELAGRLASGDLAYDDASVLEVVAYEVAVKLAVAHPGYELDQS